VVPPDVPLVAPEPVSAPLDEPLPELVPVPEPPVPPAPLAASPELVPDPVLLPPLGAAVDGVAGVVVEGVVVVLGVVEELGGVVLVAGGGSLRPHAVSAPAMARAIRVWRGLRSNVCMLCPFDVRNTCVNVNWQRSALSGHVETKVEV
jgi:hypothetical protein